MRKRIFEVIEVAYEGDRLSDIYDSFMLLTIIVSIVPLAFKETNRLFAITDLTTTVIFLLLIIFCGGRQRIIS